MVACRKQGEAVGGHFHARVPTKDPERFLLIVGNVRFWFKDLHGMVKLIETNADVHGPIEILVPPYILHHIIIVSEVAWFLEQQTDVFDPDINYNEAEFNLLARMD